MGLKSMIRKWLLDNSQYENKWSPSVPKSRDVADLAGDTTAPYHLVLHNADGGKVVQIMQTDPNTGHRDSSLYIIRDDEDIGKALHRIMLVNSLVK